jgi:hypothetical protein
MTARRINPQSTFPAGPAWIRRQVHPSFGAAGAVKRSARRVKGVRFA